MPVDASERGNESCCRQDEKDGAEQPEYQRDREKVGPHTDGDQIAGLIEPGGDVILRQDLIFRWSLRGTFSMNNT